MMQGHPGTMTRVKIRTEVDSELLQAARALAHRRGLRLADIFAEALREYLARQPGGRASLTEAAWGILPVSREELEELLRLDPSDA